jgi:hypothetical protein
LDVDVPNADCVNIDDEGFDNVSERVPVAPPKAEKLPSLAVVNECEELELPKAEEERVELDRPLIEGKTGVEDKGVAVMGT